MNHENFEKNLAASSKRLVESVNAPDDFIYAVKRRSGITLTKKVLILVSALLCISILSIASFAMFMNDFIVIPGFGAFSRNNSKVTHSIASTIEHEKDGFTYKIIAAYILDGEIYIKALHYETTDNDSLEPQFQTYNIKEWAILDYEIYYNNKKLDFISKGFGGYVMDFNYKMPSVKANEIVAISIYMGDNFIAEIEFLPITADAFNRERLHSTVDEITIIADIQRQGNIVQVQVSAVLPSDANYGKKSTSEWVNSRGLGFSEDGMYIKDSNDNIYFDKVSIQGSQCYLTFSHSIYHIFYYEIPADVDEFTIVIPQITYISKNKDKAGHNLLIEKKGSWKIHIKTIQ